MICEFNWCEFDNVVLGGIVTGIIASLLIFLFTELKERYVFFRKYKHLISKQDLFDWNAFSMLKDDGRKREDTPNGSTASVLVKKKTLQIILKDNAI